MRKVTATEARKRWFRLLDQVAEGEVIVLQRRGRRLILRREETVKSRAATSHPDYRRLLRVPRINDADRWSWAWSAHRALRLRRRSGQ